jgi:YVTN family beta-propeller protein
MEFHILGPVEVVNNGRPLALGPSKQRALLAVLLLHLNEVVPRDRLVEDLWGDRAPETATTALHGYVSQLRKLLEPANGTERRVLITRAPGYLLELEPAHVDLKRFELLAQRGKRELADADAEAAAATLAEALSLWRGPPLAEFSSAPFALAESLRLQDLRISTLEDRIEADLARGRHDELIGELERLVAEHPFRERLCGQLMLALYRCGRQAEALDIYRQTRHRLVEELGIEPGPTLQELEQAILRHEQAIALAAPNNPARTIPAPRPTAEPLGRTDDGAPAAVGQGPPRPHRSAARRRLLAIATVIPLAVAAGLAFTLSGGAHHPTMLLAQNSVGFIDAKSDRVTRSFPVGREPRALAVAFGSIWVANYADTTVTRIDRTTGHTSTIPVYGHPTGIVAFRTSIWVWTLEGLLVAVDPRFDTSGHPIHLQAQAPNAGKVLGGIATGGGFLWAAAPPETVIRIDPADPSHFLPIVPDAGVQGPIDYRDGQAWVAGSDKVFPIDAQTGIARSTIPVGIARDLTVTDTDLWIVSGDASHIGGVGPALRRLDLESRLIADTIVVGRDAVSVTAAGGSIWVASGSDGTVSRIDPEHNRVVDSISVGESPTALAADENGVWIAVR